MRVGVVARADGGGLASMTREAVRHLDPDRVLVIDLGERGRGPSHAAEWYPAAVVNVGMDHELAGGTVRAFAEGLDVIYCAETTYAHDFVDHAHAVGARIVVHAMPELWRADLEPPDAVWLPTTWEADRLPDAPVVPVPVARDRFPYRRREGCDTFLHVYGPAFHDRNGLRLLMSACRHVTKRCRLIVRGGKANVARRIGTVTIEHDRTMHADYWRGYPDEADVLVLPRRYGGLSLPVQEAASLGLPVVMLDLPPYNAELPAESFVATRGPGRGVAMVGGRFQVADADPRVLARKMDELVAEPDLVAKLSEASDAFAESISWDRWASRYRELLAGVAGG